MNDGHCQHCGGVMVEGGCVSCGAGITYGRKKIRKHTVHVWGNPRITTETGVRATKETCSKCRMVRVVE